MNLGREIAPAVTIGRPRFREYPGPLAGALLAIPFAGIAVFGFTTFRGALSPGFYWFIAACAGLMVLLSLVTTAFWLRFGITLSLRELGVAIDGHEIPYAEIESLTVHDKRRYDETVTARVLTRTVTIETAGRKVKARYVARPLEALDELLALLATHMAEETRPRAGKGWSVEHGTLVARGERVPLSAITAAGVFERDVRLWKHREDEHFFAVPYDSKNARVLLALALDRAAAAEAQAEPAPSTGIGRLLFARRTSLSSVFGNTLMAAFVLAMGWMGLERYLGLDAKLALGIVTGGFVLWIFYSLYCMAVRYRFHERAVVRSSPLGTRTLAYANVASLKWAATATSLEGAIPMGTTVKAKLVPDDGSPAVGITLHRFRGDDADLASVRNAISAHIAETMHRRLLAGEEIPWTSKATFTPAGLVVKGTLLPYDGSVVTHFHQGWLMFYRGDARSPFALLAASDVNFYPGLMLFTAAARGTVVEQSA